MFAGVTASSPAVLTDGGEVPECHVQSSLFASVVFCWPVSPFSFRDTFLIAIESSFFMKRMVVGIFYRGLVR